jgi:hypothetical protein
MKKKIMIASILATLMMLSIPMISNVKAQPAIQTQYATNGSPANVFISIHFTAGQPYNFPYNGWVFIDGKFKGHTIYGNWCGMVTMGDHAVTITRRGYSHSAAITVEYANQYFYIQLF